MVVDNKNKQKDALLWTVELLRYQGRVDLASELESWVPPKFPVGGNDLKDAGVPGSSESSQYLSRLHQVHAYLSRREIDEHCDATFTRSMERCVFPDKQRRAAHIDS